MGGSVTWIDWGDEIYVAFGESCVDSWCYGHGEDTEESVASVGGDWIC